MEQGVDLPSIEEEKKDDRIPDLEVKIGELKAELGELQGQMADLMDSIASKDRRIDSLEGQVKSLTTGIRNTANQIILDKELIAKTVAREVVTRMINSKPVPIKKTAKPPPDQPFTIVPPVEADVVERA
jgi:predicted  nucleic acid-binding Zn-ribbon protein